MAIGLERGNTWTLHQSKPPSLAHKDSTRGSHGSFPGLGFLVWQVGVVTTSQDTSEERTKDRLWKWLAHSESFSSRSVQDTAKNQEGKGKARSCPSLSIRPFLPSLRRCACIQSALKPGRPGHLSESIRGEGDGELVGQQACVTVETGPRSQASWTQGLLGAGLGHGARCSGCSSERGSTRFLLPMQQREGSWGEVHSWRLQARGLTGCRAPRVGAPGDRSRLGVPQRSPQGDVTN